MMRAAVPPVHHEAGWVARGDIEGFSLLELVVALTIFSASLLAIAHAGFVTSKALRAGRSYMAEWTAAQGKLDSLAGLGWVALAGETGSDVVNGHTVHWSVQGNDPREITLVVHRQVLGAVAADTFMTYVANRN